MISAFLRHFFRSGNEHSVHSPFVFELYRDVIRERASNRTRHPELVELRKQLRASDTEIEILDLGAGSRIDKSNKRRIGQIARNAEKPEKFGRLFYRLCHRFKPATVIELGTSLGLTTLFFSKAIPEGKVYTFEGCPQTSEVAADNFYKSDARNITIITGNIDQTLAPALEKINKPADMVYFDANHRYEPTIRYFRECLRFIHPDSVFIIDDIYWSKEMTRAWDEIRRHPEVTLTIDLFWIGLVFFRKGQVKEDFVLRF